MAKKRRLGKSKGTATAASSRVLHRKASIGRKQGKSQNLSRADIIGSGRQKARSISTSRSTNKGYASAPKYKRTAKTGGLMKEFKSSGRRYSTKSKSGKMYSAGHVKWKDRKRGRRGRWA
jgi:hypothetical protein